MNGPHKPRAAYNNVDGSIVLETGAGTFHFYGNDVAGLTAADIARQYLAYCVQEVGKADPATGNGKP